MATQATAPSCAFIIIFCRRPYQALTGAGPLQSPLCELLPESFALIGIARADKDNQTFRQELRDADCG